MAVLKNYKQVGNNVFLEFFEKVSVGKPLCPRCHGKKKTILSGDESPTGWMMEGDCPECD